MKIMSEDSLVQVENLKKHFPLKKGFLSTVFSGEKETVKAVDGISFHVGKGEILGLAGESGSGKTTTGRLLLGLEKATEGSIVLEGKDLEGLSARELRSLRREMQIIFQDPFESLDPRMTVKEIIAEPLRVQRIARNEEELEERVKDSLKEVEVVPPEEFLFRFPHELSGGQRQRVAVARAFVLGRKCVVAGAPVSMLDVSIRAEILNLMLNLVQKRGSSFIYITHDVALAKHICDRVAIMYLGKIMESGESEAVIGTPLHPYTSALVAAVPVPDPKYKRSNVISGEIPSPVYPPPGCRFHTRCPYAHERCMEEEPRLVEVEKDHYVACHLYS